MHIHHIPTYIYIIDISHRLIDISHRLTYLLIFDYKDREDTKKQMIIPD